MGHISTQTIVGDQDSKEAQKDPKASDPEELWEALPAVRKLGGLCRNQITVGPIPEQCLRPLTPGGCVSFTFSAL